jgi:hypothetical protein
MVKTLRASRNKEVVRGVGRYGRSKMYHKRGLWAIKDKNGGSFPVHDKAAVAEVAAVRAPKFYPADDVPKPLHKNKVINPPKLRQVFLPSAVKWFWSCGSRTNEAAMSSVSLLETSSFEASLFLQAALSLSRYIYIYIYGERKFPCGLPMEMNLFVREYEMEKMRDVRDMALHGEEV